MIDLGCGKTTMIKRIISELKKTGVNVKGFFTDEARSNNERIGFDVHLLDDAKTVGSLARIGSSQGGHAVGKYKVHVDEFEKLVFPYLHTADQDFFIIIDEIGRMEFCSKQFKDFISKLMSQSLNVLATVPLKTTDPLITRLKKNSKVFHITKSNRDSIFSDVFSAVVEQCSSNK